MLLSASTTPGQSLLPHPDRPRPSYQLSAVTALCVQTSSSSQPLPFPEDDSQFPFSMMLFSGAKPLHVPTTINHKQALGLHPKFRHLPS